MPDEFWDWWLVEKTGWTLEQVRALSVADFQNYMAIRDGRYKYDTSLLNKNNRRRR